MKPDSVTLHESHVVGAEYGLKEQIHKNITWEALNEENMNCNYSH